MGGQIMLESGVHSRLGLWALLGIGLVLVPLHALGLSITGIGVNQTTSAQLGGPLPGASGCIQVPSSATSCSDSKTNLGSAPLTVPTSSGIDSTISTTTGSNSVGAMGSASVSLSDPTIPDFTLYPGALVRGALWYFVSLRDSDSTSFHTSAAASVSSDDFVEFSVPSLPAGERFLMNVDLSASQAPPDGSAAGFISANSGSLRVEDVTAGNLLASFDSGGGATLLDLSSLAGHQVRVSVATDIAMSAPAGFGGGVDPLGQRSFSASLHGDFVLREMAEPSTMLLLVAGLASLPMGRRRRA